jgi:outer membrane receptor for ferrienterochelin and colicins
VLVNFLQKIINYTKNKIMKQILYFLLMSICITANAQQTIEVHVEDATSKEPLYGASIFWMNTNIGSATNMEGLANIPAPNNYPANLIISYVGFQSDTIIVNAYQQHIHINIQESIVLETIEVKGQKKDSYVRSLDV